MVEPDRHQLGAIRVRVSQNSVYTYQTLVHDAATMLSASHVSHNGSEMVKMWARHARPDNYLAAQFSLSFGRPSEGIHWTNVQCYPAKASKKTVKTKKILGKKLELLL